MSYGNAGYTGSPALGQQDRAWALHSSTDSYLNWDTNPGSANASGSTPRSGDGVLANPGLQTPESDRDRLRTQSGSPTAQVMARLTSNSSLRTPPALSTYSPTDLSASDAASVLPHHGHAVSPDRPASPSYFAKLYFQDNTKLAGTVTSPTITFTSAPSEFGVSAAAAPSPGHCSTLPEPALTPPVSSAAGSSSGSTSTSIVSAPSAPSSSATSAAPPSPSLQTKSPTSSSGSSFFASLRPTSPGIASGPSASRAAMDGSDVPSKARRPSSVFEHVGNVWERFGRKVHHSRTATSEQQSASSSHSRRSASHTLPSPTLNLTAAPVDVSDHEAAPQAGSAQSQTSPLQASSHFDMDRSLSTTPNAETASHSHHFAPAAMAPSHPSISSTQAPAASAPQIEDLEEEELAYLIPDTRDLASDSMVGLAGTTASSSSHGHSSQRSHTRASSLLERVLIQVTDDNERFSVVDISGVESADAIKERMFAKLHLFDADFSSFQLYRTEIGQSEATGPVVNDDVLLVLCLQMGDDRGTLKFLVQQTAPSANSTARAVPPPTAPIGSARVHGSEGRAGQAASSLSAQQQLHFRTSSQSSKSSLSDALVHPEIVTGDGSHEGSNRNSGSSLTRSKATARRALPSAPMVDDLRSPVQSSTGFAMSHSDRRSIASSTDGSSHDRHSQSEKLRTTGLHEGDLTGGEVLPAHITLSQRTSSILTTPTPQPNSRPVPATPASASRNNEQEPSASRLLQAGSGIGYGHRAELSDGGQRDHRHSGGSAVSGSNLTIHNTKSMDDLRHQRGANIAEAEATKSEIKMHGTLDRDGRYPDPEIMRPSTAAPAAGRDSIYGHRQYSSEADTTSHTHSNVLGQLDARMLQRNRSAQAALPGGTQVPIQQTPSRMSSTPQMRSPPAPGHPSLHGPVDPRYLRSNSIEDHRYGATSAPPGHPMSSHATGTMPRPQYGANPSYGYTAQTMHQPPRSMPVSPAFVNEFGARGPTPGYATYHGRDPRMSVGMQNPSQPRPYSYPENPHHPPPSQQQLQAYGQSYSQHSVPLTSPYRAREDPFTARYFPASSSRQVSEFQLQAGHLAPGMTVQETLRSRTPVAQPNYPYTPGSSQPSTGHSFGPRDPRQPTSAQNGQHSAPAYAGYAAPQNTTPMPSRQPYQPQQSQQTPAHHYQQHQHQHQSHQHQHPQHAQQRVQLQASPRPHSYPSPQPAAMLPPLRNPHDRPPSVHQATSQIPSSAASRVTQSSTNSSSGSGAESQVRDPPTRTGGPERFSGSSFSSQSSSRARRYSEEGHQSGNSIEDSYSAPTSARSSQSGPSLAKGSGVTSMSGREDGDLADEELANVRPLPRLPGPAAIATPTNPKAGPIAGDAARVGLARKSEDEDTLRAGEWASLWRALEPKADGTMTGTAVSGSSGGDGDTLRAEPSTPGSATATVAAAPSTASSSEIKLQRAPSLALQPDENGTVASFGTFDDDESESGTWAQPLDSEDGGIRLPLKPTNGQDDAQASDEQGTLQPGSVSPLPTLLREDRTTNSSSPRRPELRLTIDPAVGPTQVAASSSSRLPQNSPLPGSAHLSALSSGGITRSNSFARRDDDWAFRPPPEQLYENLDDFFPKHDLDKPLLDTAAVPESPLVSSPRAEASPASTASLAAPSSTGQQHPAGQRSRHKKSIRLVAQDRKRFLDRSEKRTTAAQESGASTGLVRRRSTKLWGTKVVEMTPGQEATTPASAVSAESPSSDTAQKPVFKWVKGDLIGKGTYGRVYLALNATTGEMIAVKQVELPRTASDREDTRQKGVVAALKSEIETLKDLDHPHIVSYLGFEETTQFLSIFLEYVPGGSVGSCLRKHGKFEEQTIKSFLHQILEGLAYLHSKGILHRDLKADNILVDFEGICKISDFGTVRRSDDIYGNVENMSLQGSIFWMAPEVVSLSKKGYSAKVDIWSLGCVVLEMFAGRRPWSDDEAVQAMFKIGAERKAPPIPADVKLSKQAAHFLKNCFEIDPAKRPTAQRLLDHVFSVPEENWHFQQSALWRSLQR